MNNRQIGKNKEQLAGIFLNSNGIRIIHYNFTCKIGEIDIIGYDNDTLVFFEVKYRRSANKGSAACAVTPDKQKKICRVSDYYRMINKISEFTQMRFDVIAIDGTEINWIENAFDYIGR